MYVTVTFSSVGCPVSRYLECPTIALLLMPVSCMHADLDITGWVPPNIDTGETLMYPSLLDADSPELGRGTANGLSYALVGNESLALYYVVARAYIYRLPVAWVSSDTACLPTHI